MSHDLANFNIVGQIAEGNAQVFTDIVGRLTRQSTDVYAQLDRTRDDVGLHLSTSLIYRKCRVATRVQERGGAGVGEFRQHVVYLRRISQRNHQVVIKIEGV